MQDFNELINNVYKEIKDDFHGHSEFQIENFIIGSQPTDYGKYKQCVLELRTRINSYNNIEDKIKNLKKENENSKQIDDYLISLEDIKREIYIINKFFQELKEKIKDKDIKKLEIEYWDHKFQKEIMSHLMVGSPIPVGLLQNVMSLPDSCHAKQQINSIVQERISYVKKIGK